MERPVINDDPTMSEASKEERAETIIAHLNLNQYDEGIVQTTNKIW